MGILKGLFKQTVSDIMAPYWYTARNFQILITQIRKTVVFHKKLILREPSAWKQFIIQVSDLTLEP